MAVLRRSLCRSRRLAMALIAVTFLGTSGSWHVDSDDPDCVSPLAHSHSTHHERLVRAAATAPGVHCGICHWLQSFRAEGARQPRGLVALIARSTGPTGLVIPIRSAGRLNLPSRAPPSPDSTR